MIIVVLGILFLNALRCYNTVFTIKSEDRVGRRERKPILLKRGCDVITIFKFLLNFKPALVPLTPRSGHLSDL